MTRNRRVGHVRSQPSTSDVRRDGYGRGVDDATARSIERVTTSPLFPFDKHLQVKSLGPLMDTELTREGEGGRLCQSCSGDEPVWWTDERWKITAVQPTINPVGLFLETVEHIDFEHFDDELACEFGRLTVHLEAAVRSLDSVGRVHIHRWGDGSNHFHVWFQGRPAKQLELHGWGNVLWSQVLDPLPTDVIDANHTLVVSRFSERCGGTVVAR